MCHDLPSQYCPETYNSRWSKHKTSTLPLQVMLLQNVDYKTSQSFDDYWQMEDVGYYTSRSTYSAFSFDTTSISRRLYSPFCEAPNKFSIVLFIDIVINCSKLLTVSWVWKQPICRVSFVVLALCHDMSVLLENASIYFTMYTCLW